MHFIKEGQETVTHSPQLKTKHRQLGEKEIFPLPKRKTRATNQRKKTLL